MDKTIHSLLTGAHKRVNFFELAVGVAIPPFRPAASAVLARVGGVPVEVPLMLPVNKVCNYTRDRYQRLLGIGTSAAQYK